MHLHTSTNMTSVDTNPLHIGSHMSDYPSGSPSVDGYDSRQSSVDERSSWLRDKAADYDFCIVLPTEKGELTKRSLGYVQKLRELQFELFIYKTQVTEKKTVEDVYILFRTPLERLQAYADNTDFPLLMDSHEIETRLKALDVEIAHRPDIVKYRPYEKIYGKYSNKPELYDLYWCEPGMKHPFHEIVRLKLGSLILESRQIGGGQNLKIRRYLKSGWMKGCFPLHNRASSELIERKWVRYPFQNLPLTDMKNYFGEKIGLYFGFVEHYTFCLAIPAFVGAPCQMAIYITGDYSAPFLPFFSFFLALWSVCMLETWKRKEKTFALDWGMIDYERNETDRPDYQGPEIVSFIDGSMMRYYDSSEQWRRFVLSVVSIAGLVLLVVSVVVGIYLMRYFISSNEGGPVSESNAQLMASILNAVQIQVMNYIYTFIATALSENERHRTQTQFEDSMIAKIFLFQFVNSYASFFYLAFVAEHFGDCQGAECMESLGVNLAIIYGTRLVSSNLTGLLIPYLTYQFKFKTLFEENDGHVSRPEKEALLQPYDVQQSALDDYADVAIQFGYTALFVSALPMAACFAYLSNVVNIRGNGWKLLNLFQRPIPKGAEDIGTWQMIFLMLSVAAVITNAALTCFTMDVLDSFSVTFKYWVFIGFQWLCFALQATIMAAIPDIPEEIEYQVERTNFIVARLIDGVYDPNDQVISGDAANEPIVFQNYPMTGGTYAHHNGVLTGNMH